MAGGGSSELQRVAAEMVQLAARVRLLRDEQRAMAARVVLLETWRSELEVRASVAPDDEAAIEAALADIEAELTRPLVADEPAKDAPAKPEPKARASDHGTKRRSRKAGG